MADEGQAARSAGVGWGWRGASLPSPTSQHPSHSSASQREQGMQTSTTKAKLVTSRTNSEQEYLVADGTWKQRTT